MFIPMGRYPNNRPGLDFLHGQAQACGHILPRDTSEETHWSEIGTVKIKRFFCFQNIPSLQHFTSGGPFLLTFFILISKHYLLCFLCYHSGMGS